MRDCELVFRDRLDKLIGKYCPNDAALNTLAFYLFREAADVLRQESKEGIEKEVQSIQPNQEIETPSFTMAIRDMSAFAAQKMTFEAIKKAYSEVKSSIPLVQRGGEAQVQQTYTQPTKPVRVSGFSQNEAEFDIDLSAIPKVEIQKRPSPSKKQVQSEFVSNVFRGDLTINVDEINLRTPKSQSSSKKEEEDTEEDMPTFDASSYTEGVAYSDVPKMEVSLDY